LLTRTLATVTNVDSATVMTLTGDARQLVLDALAGEDSTSTLALFVEVTGVRSGAFTYDLFFSELSSAEDGAVVQREDDLTMVFNASSVDRLRGARLEVAADAGGGLVLVNPNTPTPEEAAPGVPPEVLAKGLGGQLAQLAMAVLEHQVNPAIAAHGGRADLVALDDERHVAYVRLSGGCQGCAMSRMTLSQGIEQMLREEIPELTDVIDVTDHALGENPFYAR
jgi:Fe/S biogenesis protein NfuA